MGSWKCHIIVVEGSRARQEKGTAGFLHEQAHSHFELSLLPEIQLSVRTDLQNRQHAQHWHADRRTSSLHFGKSLFLFKEIQFLPEVTCNKLKHFQSTPSAPHLLSHHLFLYHTENHFRCHISHMAQPPLSWASEFKNSCSKKTHNCVSPYVS